MEEIKITSTQLKIKTSDILDNIRYNNTKVIIEKHGKPIAVISPYKEKNIDKLIDDSFGRFPDFPYVRKYRKFNKKDLSF